MRTKPRRASRQTLIEYEVRPRKGVVRTWVPSLTLLATAALASVFAFEIGRFSAHPDVYSLQSELESLRESVRSTVALKAEADERQHAAQGNLSVEQSLSARLTAQVQTLEAENATLKADLAFYEQLTQADQGVGVSLRGAEVGQVRSANGSVLQFRVVVGQGAKAARNFKGKLQLVADLQVDGAHQRIEMPQNPSAAPPTMQLDFKLFQRVQGELVLPKAAVVTATLVRVLDDSGKLVLEQPVVLGNSRPGGA